MTTISSTTYVVHVEPLFTDTERAALAGFLAGYSGRACATIARRLRTVSGFHRYALAEELLEHSPAVHVRRPRLDYESHVIGLDQRMDRHCASRIVRRYGCRVGSLGTSRWIRWGGWVVPQGRSTLGKATIRAGQLYTHRRRGAESASFTYDERYLANRGAYALDPALPLFAGVQQTPNDVTIFRAFADSSPDRWGRNLISRAERRRATDGGQTPRSLGDFDLLLRVRDDLGQGAIRYRVGETFLSEDASGVPAMTDLPTLLSAADDVVADSDDEQSLELLLRAGSSLGGARPKVHVRDDNSRIAIAKFPRPSDDWKVMAWEKTALDLAAMAGITVPTNHLVRVAGRDVLIVDRFDRAPGGRRIGYMSAMTVLEARDGEVRSYLDIAEAIEERSRTAAEELRQLWRRIAFSILISNTDDHLRNHAFLHVDGDSWQLSLAFDLNPNPDPGPKDLSTAIANDTRAEVRALLEVADLFRLTRADAVAIVAEVNTAVRRWTEVASVHGLSRNAINAMAPAFEHQQAELAQNLVCQHEGRSKDP